MGLIDGFRVVPPYNLTAEAGSRKPEAENGTSGFRASGFRPSA